MLLREKKEIEDWLNHYNIQNYVLIENQKYGYVVDVYNCVELSYKRLKNIKVKFNKVEKWFDCSNNELESLEGCPNIVRKAFYCHSNLLKTLEGCPEVVGENFNCSYNELTSLEGCPKFVGKAFYGNNNNLLIEYLKYLPEIVENNYIKINNNEELGELENINNFDNLKEKVE